MRRFYSPSHRNLLLLIAISFFIAGLFSLTRAAGQQLWQDADPTGPQAAFPALPRSFRAVQLNQAELAARLAAAPMEFSGAAQGAQPLISLPLPDGKDEEFRFEESPVFEPELAAQFPDVRFYRAQGVDDPAATARFGWSPYGFHAVILSERGEVYVTPAAEGDTVNYITFYKSALQDGFTAPSCEVTEAMQARDDLAAPVTEGPAIAVGSQLRTYRLAIATTVEYTLNSTYGGSKSATLTKLGTIVNLINAVYEREVAIRFQLVANELNIIFDAEPDGLDNSNPGTMINQSTNVINTGIGSGSYDIGHAFGLSNPGGSSGVAYVGVVCGSNKGGGASALGIARVTGNFTIDAGLVAHEWGHQFSARHTFNSTSNGCNGNRTASTAYEPGSGSTLMAYSGICTPENLQNNADNYFHTNSYEAIATFAQNSATCAAQTATGNTPPTVSAGADYTIPRSTPFMLTATASDPNGDALTYSWEQYDLGQPSPPMDDDGTRPLMRSWVATSSPSRTFPRLPDLIANTSNIGERLPTTTRTMNFRVTARDNRAGGSGVNNDAMVVSVAASAGPFTVTQPNTALTWTGGTSQTVTWNVANTGNAPVSCANVRILLSTDGGNTYSTVILASTANDGTEAVSVPNTPTTQARIRVEAVGNIFFDISNANFTIVGGCAVNLGQASRSFAANGGAGTVGVTAASCSWTASSNVGWITITGGGSGTGSGTVSYSVTANSAATNRSGQISVGGQTHTVYQGANFADVPPSHLFYNEIGRLSARGVTLGCGGSNYCPNAVVTREQMAAFIMRARGEFNPPAPPSQRFLDVPPSNPFYAFIDRLAALGITQGCGGSNYCPNAVVTREQMAAFIIRALNEFNPPTPGSQRYQDVPPSNIFYNFIDRMAVLGITQGCQASPPLYCPAGQVTREQMAAFLVRAFNL